MVTSAAGRLTDCQYQYSFTENNPDVYNGCNKVHWKKFTCKYVMYAGNCVCNNYDA